MFVIVLDTFLVSNIIFRWIPVSHQSKLLVNQSLCIWKKLSRRRLTRCYKWGVLKPVNQATPRIKSFVLVEGKDKQGNHKLRICLDLTNINKVNVKEPYHFKTPEDIAHLLAEAYVITVCDCRKGYWHQQLDEASLLLTTFSTELGRFCYTAMSFGATVAGDVFQRKLDECFGKLKQVSIIAGHILVFGCKPDHSDYDLAFTSLLHTAQKCIVKLNSDKLQYKKNEVDFSVETYTTSGNKPARSKVSAITAMPSPTNKKQVQSFICMINYLSKFLSRLSEFAELIREFSRDKVPFNWGTEQQAPFKQMKKEISCSPVLAYYNPKKQSIMRQKQAK